MKACLVLVPHLGTTDIIPALTSLGLLPLGLCISYVMNYLQISD